MAICEAVVMPALPLSPEQQAVLVSPRRGRGKHVLSVELPELDESCLQRAIAQVCAAHSVLRHVFQHDVDGWQQRCAPALPELQRVQVSSFAEWRSQFIALPMELTQAPLIQVVLVTTAEPGVRLVLGASELITDAASLHALVRQIAAAYSGAPAGEWFQYDQYIQWRAALAESEDAGPGRQYWNTYLRAATPLSPPRLLVRRRHRDAGRRYRSRGIDSTRIVVATQRLGTSIEVLLQAVWWLLLARLGGFSRYLGGWRHDCRSDYDLMQGAVGVFEKVLPMIIDAQPHETFSAWLERSAATARNHMDAQEYGAEYDQEDCAEAHAGVGFGCAEGTQVPGWHLQQATDTAGDWELFLHAVLQPEGGHVALSADAALYSEPALACLLEQFTTLLDSALENPSARLDQLRVISSSERQRSWMQAAPVDCGRQTVAEHISRWAQRTPQAPAIEAEGHIVTYAELLQRAERLASWLRLQGVARGDLVALDLPRSADWVIAMLATWRAGAAYLPLEPDWPATRRAVVIADAAPALVLHAKADDFIAGLDCPQLALSDAPNGDVVVPPVATTLSDVAYVLYTSGSTGKPKGAVIEHGALLNYVVAASSVLELGRARRWALTNSMAADLGNTALFGALFNGGCLVIGGPQHTHDAAAFARFMREQRIDGLKMVPSHLEALLECDAPCLPQVLVLGGEAASPGLVQRIRQLAPACALYNHYGPTETTVGVMVHAACADDLDDVLPLTQVLANNRVLVLDESLQLVPTGALGQLYIGGPQLCRGYLHDAAPSACIADPWHPGQRLYRTGDLAHVRPEGGLQLAGRADHQVKIRGFRIEPAEIEAELLACAGVRQAAVLAVASGELALVACVVLEATDLQAQIAAEIAQRLPSYMLPARYVVLSEFPRLGNGKIDRVALSSAVSTQPQACVPTRMAPRTTLETALVDCMAEVLGRAEIGIDEDFFALGGQSLLAIKLAARIGRLLHVEVQPGLVIECPTVAQLAQRLAGAASDAIPAVQLATDGAGVPLYCFAGTLGNGSEFAALASALRAEHPVTAFICHTLGPNRWQWLSIVELAREYADFISARDAGQGCALLGWSFGGDLAYETARQLQGRVDVRFLGVVDVSDRQQVGPANTAPAEVLVSERITAWLQRSAMHVQWQQLLEALASNEQRALLELLAARELPCDGPAFESSEYELWVLLRVEYMRHRYLEAGRVRLDIPLYSWIAAATGRDPARRPREWRAFADVQSELHIAGATHRSILGHEDFVRSLRLALQSALAIS